jgi:hypothetical protein
MNSIFSKWNVELNMKSPSSQYTTLFKISILVYEHDLMVSDRIKLNCLWALFRHNCISSKCFKKLKYCEKRGARVDRRYHMWSERLHMWLCTTTRQPLFVYVNHGDVVAFTFSRSLTLANPYDNFTARNQSQLSASDPFDRFISSRASVQISARSKKK